MREICPAEETRLESQSSTDKENKAISFAAGTRLGRYEIRSPLGAGGMGEVYLARDTELDRTVAIKILPEALAGDQQRLQRFIQEAKAASALNHPHILTIHEIGAAAGAHFIATEFIDGVTLRQRIAAGMKLTEVLEIAAQASSALSAAHAAGIIHRDIKPENIMVRRDGYIKVLDFGLAKLTEPKGSPADTEAPTRAMVNTGAGTVMGTANYMSPEQAKGIHVDARADLWSLGAVLYEMVTGHVPFAGETPTETISLILQKEPPPLARFAHDVPAELDRIVTKALTKDREERYQTAKDMLIDLRNLKRKLEVDAEIDRTVPPEFRGAVSTGSTSGPTAPAMASGSVAPTAPAAAHAASSAEYIVSGIKQHKLAALIAAIVLVVGAIGLAAYLHTRNTDAAIDSIAVLPFVNQSGNPDTEYLSDGLTESIINNLTQLSNLKVIARSSVFRYKGKDTDPLKAGHDLGVRAVLTGRLLQRGDSLMVSTELLDVRDNKQLWGEQYNRKLADALAVQQEISREITDRLRLKLTGEEQRQVTRHDTSSPEAYQSYLKGRYYWNKRTAENIRRAIEQFQQAADKDPNYALADVGLADCYLILEEYAGTPASETLPKAKAFAERALRLDGSLAEAHTSLAFVHHSLWQWDEAEKEFKRSIELNPNYPTTHHWYSLYLRNVGRFDPATAEIKHAQALDPLSLVINVNVVEIYLRKGDTDSAIEQSKKIIELDPSYPPGHLFLGLADLKQERYSEAIAELQKAVELSGRASESLGGLGYAYAISGKRTEARKVLEELEEKYTKHEAIGQNLAEVYVGLGERDQAFAWLEKDFQARSSLLAGIRWVEGFESLRNDPRYADLVRRMGLPQ